MLKIKNLSKIYDDGTRALNNINLEIKDNEFVSLLGPSGCGKTTILRLIAGLEEITEGKILLNEKELNIISPDKRDIAMVFQSYALYPHLTVFDNISLNLKVKKINQLKINEKVDYVTKLLNIDDLKNKKPKHLSGGQRQRVALARALVRSPAVFLLDEPLSNLDLKFRENMRHELKNIQLNNPKTTIFVTHDQEEATALSDRIAVIDNGVLQQFDIPSVIYNKPTNIFVSKFVGSPSINLFKANVVNSILFVGEDKICETILNNQEVILGVRPENIKISDNGIPVKFCFEEISGGVKYLYFESEISMNKYIVIQQDNDYKVSGEQFFLKLHKNKINIFDQNTELLIDF